MLEQHLYLKEAFMAGPRGNVSWRSKNLEAGKVEADISLGSKSEVGGQKKHTWGRALNHTLIWWSSPITNIQWLSLRGSSMEAGPPKLSKQWNVEKSRSKRSDGEAFAALS
ncbi:hypothetical protein AKJ16_DCAP12852 [Drosera capensis]